MNLGWTSWLSINRLVIIILIRSSYIWLYNYHKKRGSNTNEIFDKHVIMFSFISSHPQYYLTLPTGHIYLKSWNLSSKEMSLVHVKYPLFCHFLSIVINIYTWPGFNFLFLTYSISWYVSLVDSSSTYWR